MVSLTEMCLTILDFKDLIEEKKGKTFQYFFYIDFTLHGIFLYIGLIKHFKTISHVSFLVLKMWLLENLK